MLMIKIKYLLTIINKFKQVQLLIEEELFKIYQDYLH